MHFDWSACKYDFIVLFFMKHENGMSNVVWLSPSCDNLQYIHASYIVFLFVNNENNNFIKEIKHVVCASIACWKPRLAKFVRILEQVKSLDCISGFHWSALKSSKRLPLGRHWKHDLFYFLIEQYFKKH